jgi:hypothetical protein
MKQPSKKISKPVDRKTTDEQVRLFLTISPLLKSAFNEVKEFSKKKQDEELNVKKVKMINRLLEKAKEILKDEPTVDFLEILDENELPTNSDAVLIMSQFISAMDKFHDDHYHYENNMLSWDNEGHWK